MMSTLDAGPIAESVDGRPYRSHLRPACLPCRRRKSRCKVDTRSLICLMCRAHGTECEFPGATPTPPVRSRRAAGRQLRNASRNGTSLSTGILSAVAGDSSLPTATPTSPLSDLITAVGDAESEDNSHIVGPAVTDDTQVLTEYLSTEISITGRTRIFGPRISSTSSASVQRPVMFTAVRKHPLGLSTHQSIASQRCQIIEKLLDPWAEELIKVYFKEVNPCLPLLDEPSFMLLYLNQKEKLSPGLLAVAYAHTMVFWRHSTKLSKHHCPDIRFIWNQANEALYSELHLSPGLSTIIGILLNVGGRPTTSLMGNGIQIGAAVSLAHSLGLNRNPLAWDITPSEKYFRMKIWWGLVLHDTWCSLAYGTPPHLRKAQYDVSPPRLDYICHHNASATEVAAGSVFVALVTLTDILGILLDHIYHLNDEVCRDSPSTYHLEAKLNDWEESLTGDVRRVIIRGTHLHIKGAANLRLAYLATRLLLRRIDLDAENERLGISISLASRYAHVRRAAEEIVLLVQELEDRHLGDFWLPVSAFTFTSTMTFLLRCALETENSAAGLADSTSLKLAKDLIDALQSHQRRAGWDIGDICLAQYADAVDMLIASTDASTSVMPELQHVMLSNVPDIDELFPGLWDNFGGT